MSEHQMPKTYEDAIAQGYTPITDLQKFVTGTLGLTMEQFNSKSHNLALDPNSVDCSTAPAGTLCRRQCITTPEGKRHGIIGKCNNGGCNYASGPC